jgi:spermidine synthase
VQVSERRKRTARGQASRAAGGWHSFENTASGMSRSSIPLDDGDDSCDSILLHTPFLHRRPDTLALHFDYTATQSEMRCDAPDELVLGYTRTMMGFLLFNPNPGRIAMIGLGGGSIAKYCYARLPDASIAVAEINPEVIALRDEFCVPRDDERLQVVCQDGADFVRRATKPFDILIVDGYVPAGPAPQLCTQRFYDDCYRKLAPGGVMAVNLVFFSEVHARSIARIRHSFANAVVVVESEDPGNRIVFATKGGAMGLPDKEWSAGLGRLEGHHAVNLQRTFRCIRDALETESLTATSGSK